MYGKPQSVALKYIKDHMRKKRVSDPQPEIQSSEPQQFEPDSQTNRNSPTRKSDDNEVLFASLASHITMHLDQKLESHMQSLNNKIDRLSMSLFLQSRLQTTPKDSEALRTPSRFFPSAPGPSMGNAVQPDGSREAFPPGTQSGYQRQWAVPDAARGQSESNLQEARGGGALLAPEQKDSTPVNLDSVTLEASAGSRLSLNLLEKLEDAEGEAAEAKEQVKINKLKDTMVTMERLQEAEANSPGALRRTISQWKEDMSVHRKDAILDVCMALIILANSVVIGISMDYDTPTIDILDLCFTVTFIVELCCKFYLHGFVQHFSHGSNVFDFFIVSIDILQLALELANIDLLSDAPAASIFRVARLVRLVRLVRLARLEMLDDLVSLISGMVGGISTLAWSIVLFFLILYITALLFREFFGQSSYIIPGSDEDMIEYFDSVPRCMLTVFRFFFGDFQTISGMNLFEGIMECYGAVAAVAVCAFFFVITIGLFNVIAAIFVESTLAAANHAQIVRKTERMNNEILWASRLTILVRKIFEYNGVSLSGKTSEILAAYGDKPIPEAVFQRYMQDPHVVAALNALEIDESDHKYLFDILDNDNTGSIFISQLSDGLERLRGDPRRSDIICVDLMLRSVQSQTDFLVQAAKTNVKTSSGNRKKMDENQSCLYRIERMLSELCSQPVQGQVMSGRSDRKGYDI